MSDFNTIPARPLSEKPDEEPEKKEEKKPTIDIQDWNAEPPAPEPDFFKSNDEATRISEHPLDIEPKPIEIEQPAESAFVEDAQSAKTVAFEQMTPVEPEILKASAFMESLPVEESKINVPELVEPVYHIPEAPKAVEPEVFETPAYKPTVGGVPSTGEPPKKNKTWLIILIVVLLLCLCCVAVVVVLGIFLPAGTFDMSQVSYVLPI